MKIKYVFEQGRDLNITDVADVNLTGQWARITDGAGRLHVVNVAKVNYIVETQANKAAAV